MIVNEWEPHFTARYGHTFPDTYLCLDTEYTGGDERTDFVMEIGHVMVKDRRVVDQLNVVLDWSAHSGVDVELLKYKLNHIKSVMGRNWRITWDVMKDEGIAPFKALKFYRQFFKKWDSRNLPYVAHNGRVAEERMLRGAFNRYLNRSFVIGDNQLWDTGAIFKATALLESTNSEHMSQRWKCFPQRTDSMKEYFNRVLSVRARGLYWKLKLCLEHYDLTEKLNHNHRYHQAVHDAYCSHLLMQAYREELTRHNTGEEVEEESVDVLEQLHRDFPELAEVPSQPLDKSVKENVPVSATTASPPHPVFQNTPTTQTKESRRPDPVDKPETEVSEVEASKPLPTRGRKRGQRVV